MYVSHWTNCLILLLLKYFVAQFNTQRLPSKFYTENLKQMGLRRVNIVDYFLEESDFS